MNRSRPSTSDEPWGREAQRTLCSIYQAAVEDLVSAARSRLPAGARLYAEWALRELELASTRLFADEREFIEEMDELLGEARKRIVEQIDSSSNAA